MTDAPDGARTKSLLKDRPLKFAGQQFTLRLAMVGFIALKEKWGIEEDAPLIARLARERITDAPALIWACLQTHHAAVTYEDVVTWCDDAETDELQLAIATAKEALMAGWGTPEKKHQAAATKKAS